MASHGQEFERVAIKEEYDFKDRGETDLDGLMCRSKGCSNKATCLCDGQMMFFREQWEGCKRQLCEEHAKDNKVPLVVGIQRCFDPECDMKLKKAIAKQAGICCGILAIPTILFIIILTIILSDATFSSPFYDVSKEYGSGTITCNPIEGPHTSTLIFFHPLTEKASEYLGWFIKDNGYAIAPRKMKLIFPQAPTQTNQWYGQEPVASWFDEFEGKNASAYVRATDLYNSTELEIRQRAISNVTLLQEVSEDMVEMIKREMKLLPPGQQNSSNIYIAGIGQGAMLSLSTFLSWTGPDPLGGVIGLLGYQALPINMTLDWKDLTQLKFQRTTPMLLYNGAKDKLAPALFTSDSYLHFKDEIYVKQYSKNIVTIMEPNLSHQTGRDMIEKLREELQRAKT